MLSARTLLHVLITVSVVLHGAWMAAMPIAHAAPLIEAEASVDHSAHAAHADHAGHHHTAGHHHHDSVAVLDSAPTSCSKSRNAHATPAAHDAPAHHSMHHDDVSGHEGHGGGHDHDMSGCECTLCKISSLAAVETQLQLVALSGGDARPRLHPAEQVQATTGPPVGPRAPPAHI